MMKKVILVSSKKRISEIGMMGFELKKAYLSDLVSEKAKSSNYIEVTWVGSQ